MNRHVLAAARTVAVVCGAAVLAVVRDPVVVGIAGGLLLAVVIDLVRTSPRRQRQLDDRVVFWLAWRPDGATALAIAGGVRRPSGAIYPTLARLESTGRITSHWEPGPNLRRRIYRAALADAPAENAPPPCDIHAHGGCNGQDPICRTCPDAPAADVTPLRRPRRDVRRG